MDTQKLLEYMESIRIGRKMSQAAYLFEIVSQRQYYRYRNGESEMPFDILVKLANRLKIPLLKIISSFQSHAQIERKIVADIFVLVSGKKYEDAETLIKKHNNLLLLDPESKGFYDLAIVLLKYYQNQITTLEMLDIIKEEIDFKNAMKKEIFRDYELYILGIIMQFSNKDRNKILNKIDQLRKNNKLILSGNISLDLQVFFWIIKNYGRASRYDQVLEMADMAIESARLYYTYYLLEYFYYYKALAHLRLNQEKEFDQALTNAIYALFQVNEFKRANFFKTIEKDTDIKVKEFIIDKIKKEFE